MLKCLVSFNTTLTWLGAISRHSCQRLGSNRLCDRRISVGSLPDSVPTTDPDGAYRYYRVRHPTIPCQPVRTILRYLSYCHCLFPLHRRKYHLVICKLRARWQTRRVSRNPPYPHQHRRCCIRPDRSIKEERRERTLNLHKDIVCLLESNTQTANRTLGIRSRQERPRP